LAFELIWHEKVKADLGSLGKEEASRIIFRIKERLTDDPARSGKPLKGIFKGLLSFRVGSYRVLYAIDHAERRVIILHIKHRKNAYRRS